MIVIDLTNDIKRFLASQNDWSKKRDDSTLPKGALCVTHHSSNDMSDV
jgi:hypothetical protein